jgi:hypothetical protein
MSLPNIINKKKWEDPMCNDLSVFGNIPAENMFEVIMVYEIPEPKDILRQSEEFFLNL